MSLLISIKLFKYGKKKRNKNYSTPLHKAAGMNSKEISELFISKGAEINAKDMTN